MKKILSALLAMTMIFSLAACSDKDDDSNRKKSSKTEKSDDNIIEEILDPAIEFKNTSIEEAVYAELRRLNISTKITQSALDKIEELEISGSGLSKNDNLQDLKSFRKLKKLSIVYGDFTDLSIIGELTSLTYLKISGNDYLSDLSPLSNLINLTHLDLSDNDNMTDLTPLGNLKSLAYLDVNCNNTRSELGKSITDITALGNLENLTYLNLSHNYDLSDIAPIRSLKNLTEIDLSHTDIADLSVLAELEKLEYIYLAASYYSPLPYTKESVLELKSLPNLKGLCIFNEFRSDTEIQNAFEGIDFNVLPKHLRKNN